MDIAIKVIVLAVLVEAVWETLKPIWQEGKFNVDVIGTLVLGVLIALVVRIDIFKVIDISTSQSVVGVILTGILISRGGNFIHDLFNRLEGRG